MGAPQRYLMARILRLPTAPESARNFGRKACNQPRNLAVTTMPSTLANLIKQNALRQADAFMVRNRILEWRASPGQRLLHAIA